MAPSSWWNWSGDSSYFFKRLVVASIVMAVVWSVAKFYSGKYMHRLSAQLQNENLTNVDKQKIKRTNLIYFELSNLLYYGLILIGFSVSLSILGVSNTTLLTVMGTIGFALSLSMQKYLTSVVSGVVISTNDWFNIGDDISLQFQQTNGLPPITGRVADFDLLRTIMIDNQNQVVSVPNDLFLSNTIYYTNKK